MVNHFSCTSLDHIYPATVHGTPCYCGRRAWGGTKPRPARVPTIKIGMRVTILTHAPTEQRTVVAKVRDGEVFYRVNEPFHGRALYERNEIEPVRAGTERGM